MRPCLSRDQYPLAAFSATYCKPPSALHERLLLLQEWAESLTEGLSGRLIGGNERDALLKRESPHTSESGPGGLRRVQSGGIFELEVLELGVDVELGVESSFLSVTFLFNY